MYCHVSLTVFCVIRLKLCQEETFPINPALSPSADSEIPLLLNMLGLCIPMLVSNR